MESIAVDVVLLPEPAVMDLAIEANKQLALQCPEKIILDKENCLPHISLAMGCISRRHIEPICEILCSIVATHTFGRLRIAGVFIGGTATGQSVSSIVLEPCRAIRSLHEGITEQISPYLSYDVTAQMLFNPDEIEQSTLQWIRTYRDKSSFENFFPHITLGYGWLNKLPLPTQVKPSKLALCQLGNHCTCRRLLAAIELPAED